MDFAIPPQPQTCCGASDGVQDAVYAKDLIGCPKGAVSSVMRGCDSSQRGCAYRRRLFLNGRNDEYECVSIFHTYVGGGHALPKSSPISGVKYFSYSINKGCACACAREEERRREKRREKIYLKKKKKAEKCVYTSTHTYHPHALTL